ncbi:hypothetical protein NHX12_017456, partial [Muraenolepis orangiensis]
MVNGDFAKLTRKHGIRISASFACTVEEIGLAVGEKVGHGSIKSLARMNSAVVIFLDQVEKANCVIETGITTHSDGFNETDWKKEWEGEVILSHNTSRSGGVGFPLSKSFKPVSLEVEQFINGRLLLMLLREPLIHNARLDISNSGTPGLTVALCRTKTLCLQQLVDAVGPELSDAQALGSLLGLHSVRVAQRILQLWSQILCPEEKGLLRSYGQGGARPDPADPFPEIYLSPGLGELTAPLLQVAPCS